MLERLYAWLMRASAGPNASMALFAVAFAESSFFPLPPDLMLVPMALARRERAFWFALIATVGSVLGGVLGYAIGYYFYEALGHFILSAANYDKIHDLFESYGVWIIFGKGLTPIPYKLITISAGLAHMAILPFIGASIVTRALRFLLVAGLLYAFGAPVREFIEKRLTLVLSLTLVAIVGGFIGFRYLL